MYTYLCMHIYILLKGILIVQHIQLCYPTLLHYLEILKNPPVRRLIVAGYNWIFDSSINIRQAFSKRNFITNSILIDSLSLVELLEKSKIWQQCFLFTIDFKSLHTNIPLDATIRCIQKLCFKFQIVIPNAHFIIELLELILSISLMLFDGEYFQ